MQLKEISRMAKKGDLSYQGKLSMLTIGFVSLLLSFSSSMFMVNAFHIQHGDVNKWSSLCVQQRNNMQRSSRGRPRLVPVSKPLHPSSRGLYRSRLEEPSPLSAFSCFKSSFSKRMDHLVRLGCITFLSALLLVTTAAAEAQSMDSVAPVIVPCEKTSSGTNNCVSTASVKQVDVFMLPWTWPSETSVNEIVSRIKGVIAADSTTLSLVDSNADRRAHDANENFFFRLRAARNVCTDEIEILVNPVDRVITFRSRQVEGPENISDFGANRQRLNEIRQRLAVVTVLGEDSADNGPREELSGQLRAFWGFQSGSGYEAILLEEDE
jgi:uncharacterized protein (DUF1499 family)